MNNKATISLIFFCLLTFSFISLSIINNKEVMLSLEAEGELLIEHPVSGKPQMFQLTGRDIEVKICEMLKWVNDSSDNSISTCRLKLKEPFKADPNQTYYIGIGCSIEQLPYDYFSKFMISLNEDQSEITYYSSRKHPVLSKTNNSLSINIYKGDVSLVP